MSLSLTIAGVPVADVIPLDTQIIYFRLVNPSLVSTYLAEAQVDTVVIFSTVAAAEKAYAAIAADPVAWGEKVGRGNTARQT
jgi:hypothetical protein